ncbi:MAG: TetR/AcrR family transcriptional regulator [Myxococcota bacterium]|nr:TetR/AcrR family transcriptional regulator [Myxococcota bacterium]
MSTSSPPRTTRKEAKERTRQKLFEAIVRLLHGEGPSALTTARIAEQAGIAQPTFYVYFPDLEAALDQSAEQLGETLLGRMRDTAPSAEESDPREAMRTSFRAFLDAVLADRRLAEIFLRHRRDGSTPFGKRFKKVLAQSRDRIEEQLTARGVADAALHASVIVGMTIGAVEGLLDRRIADRDAAVEALVRYTTAALAPLVIANRR